MLKDDKIIYGDSLLVPSHLNYGMFFLEKLKEHKNATALINATTGEQISYDRLMQHIVNFATSLENLGIGLGDTVGLCSENRIEYISSSVGVMCTGAIITLVNPSYSKDELGHTLKITKPKCLIMSPGAFKSSYEALRKLDFIKHYIIFGNETIKPAMMFEDLIAKNVNVHSFLAADVQGQSDGALVLYSSGTTGMPKGVLLTHLNLIISGSQPSGTKNKQVTLTVSPWCNTMGYLVESLTVVPPIVVVLAKSLHIHKYDVTSVITMYSGAAPLDLEVINATKKAFPNLMYIFQGYGMSEAAGAITRESEIAAKGPRPGSVGTVVPGLMIKVVDIEKRTVLGPNQPGEVCIKGPIIFKKYIGKSTADDFDEQGYFKTGDVAYYDDDGYLYVVDRIKELIKYKGWQVPPAELEALLLQHASVRDVGVVGAPDQLAGELPTAFIVKQSNANVTEKELVDFVQSKTLSDQFPKIRYYVTRPSTFQISYPMITTLTTALVAEAWASRSPANIIHVIIRLQVSPWKQLRGGVRFISEIPKSPSGKILRRRLREMLPTRSKL
ncbi:Luciferin 4-monooxygenase [Eumeta japonica]|uniref:Luciferin 4-monooxygenase n=1 Tax=Eumeta variegata TaxID=151549 RepID=A0A4C1TNW4_EUMVA|nr:Luciferin 4-monooxygenase [Eumeta japonica]